MGCAMAVPDAAGDNGHAAAAGDEAARRRVPLRVRLLRRGVPVQQELLLKKKNKKKTHQLFVPRRLVGGCF